MKFALQKELFRRYPALFRKPGSECDTAPIDERGIECDDGWFDLIDRLCRACESEIETLNSHSVARNDWPRVAQIKEKFGTLRFYVQGQLSDALRTQILQAEAEESARTCESCGALGQLRTGQWIRTYCDPCEAQYLSAGNALSHSNPGQAPNDTQLMVLLASRVERGA